MQDRRSPRWQDWAMSGITETRWNTEWTAVETLPGEYAITAGLDRTIDLSGLSSALGATLLSWSNGEPVAPHTADAATLAARLADLGAVLGPDVMSVAFVGDEGLCRELRPIVEAAGFATADHEDHADLAVLLRTADGWPSTDLPHLAVDARFHHTLTIGPYVLPGLTTCTDCLDRRVERRWPRLEEPEQPAGLSRPALISELLIIQLSLIRSGTSRLSNGLISWDLEAGECTHTTVLMFPGCATCDPGATNAMIELP